MNVGIGKYLEHDLIHGDGNKVAESASNLVAYFWDEILMIKNHRREKIRHQVDASDHEAEVGFRCQELVVGTQEYEKVEEA
jgi:hypothetical protein